jgi:hypothetical protein
VSTGVLAVWNDCGLTARVRFPYTGFQVGLNRSLSAGCYHHLGADGKQDCGSRPATL